MKENSRTLMDSLNLPYITDLNSFAYELNLNAKLLYFLASDSPLKYREFSIPKRDGSKRTISEPLASLKIIQKWILQNILYKIKTSKYSYGFKKSRMGSPLVLCAEKHKNNMFVLKMDLKNFYPSIKREKVFYQFVNIGYGKDAANILANICTFNNVLPQGAVTSPYLANLICRKMDSRISGCCNKRGIAYTRYADDLIFSCDNRNLLKSIYSIIKHIVEDEGFLLNEKKTLFMTPKTHKKIIGVTINDNRIKASKEYKRLVRAMIHQQIITGDYTQNEKIRGYIAYIDSIEKGYKTKSEKYIIKLIESSIALYPEVVKAFNENKMFADLPDMVNKKPNEFVSDEESEEFLLNETMIRNEYLIKNGYDELVDFTFK